MPWITHRPAGPRGDTYYSGTSFTTDSILSAEICASVLPDGKFPIAIFSGFSRDEKFYGEARNMLRTDFPYTLETSGLIRPDTNFYSENIHKTTSDYPAYQEVLSKLIDDNSLGLEFRPSLTSDLFLPTTLISTLRWDNVFNLEAGLKVLSDYYFVSESRASMLADSVAKLESISKLTTDVEAFIESLTNSQLDAFLRLENTGSVTFQGDSLLPIQYLHGNQFDFILRAENRAIVSADSVLRGEYLSNLVSNYSAVWEALVGLVADEYLLLIENSGVQAFLLDANLPIEWQVAIEAHRPFISELLAGISADSSPGLETINKLIGGSKSLVEILSGISNDFYLKLESSTAFDKGIAFLLAVQSGVSSNAAINAEVSVDISWDSRIYSELVVNLLRDHPLYAESLIGIIISRLSKLESLTMIRADINSISEVLYSLRSDQHPYFDITGAFITHGDTIIPIESLHAGLFDSSLWGEFRAGISANPLISAESLSPIVIDPRVRLEASSNLVARPSVLPLEYIGVSVFLVNSNTYIEWLQSRVSDTAFTTENSIKVFPGFVASVEFLAGLSPDQKTSLETIHNLINDLNIVLEGVGIGLIALLIDSTIRAEWIGNYTSDIKSSLESAENVQLHTGVVVETQRGITNDQVFALETITGSLVNIPTNIEWLTDLVYATNVSTESTSLIALLTYDQLFPLEISSTQLADLLAPIGNLDPSALVEIVSSSIIGAEISAVYEGIWSYNARLVGG